MSVVYFDLISGLSGDMTVGALLDLGFPRERLRRDLAKLPGLKCRFTVGKKLSHGIRAATFKVQKEKEQRSRSWAEIQRLIKRSTLGGEVKERGLEIFAKLAKVEGRIHGVRPEEVHFHEVGALDSIVDVMATAIGTHYLKVDSFACSSIPLGRGLTQSRHGTLPLPAPATLELLKGFPVHWTSLEEETVTPTGAAILCALATPTGDAPPMTLRKVGYGAGEKEFPDRPNLVRLLLGEGERTWGRDEMLVLETNIDDMNPELYDYLMERLFSEGARDVWLTPIQMKKNRPGTLLRILAEPSSKDRLAKIVLQESSAIGLRYYPVQRLVLKRVSREVKTRYGSVGVKVVDEPDGGKRVTPEYEDLKKIARVKSIPLKTLYDEVVKNFKK